MEDIYGAFYQEGNPSSKNHTLNELFECQKNYAKFLREYKPEIEYIENYLKELRKEEKLFYEKELPEILEILKSDEIGEEVRKEWIEKLQGNMEKSFYMSRNLLQDLAVKQMDEFRRDVEKILRGGVIV